MNIKQTHNEHEIYRKEIEDYPGDNENFFLFVFVHWRMNNFCFYEQQFGRWERKLMAECWWIFIEWVSETKDDDDDDGIDLNCLLCHCVADNLAFIVLFSIFFPATFSLHLICNIKASSNLPSGLEFFPAAASQCPSAAPARDSVLDPD